jgi:hypothetical protein
LRATRENKGSNSRRRRESKPPVTLSARFGSGEKDMVIPHLVHKLPGTRLARCQGRLQITARHMATTLLVLGATAAGCGGGGGGGSPALAPAVTPTYPTLMALSKVDSQGASYRADAVAGQLSSAPSISQGLLAWNGGQLTGVSLEVSIPSQNVAFAETFSSPGTRQLEIAPGNTVALYVANKTASDGSERSLLLLDPTSAGLSYSTLGYWTYAGSAAATSHYGGRFHLGAQTVGRDIPTSGTASFVGVMLGTFADGSALYDVSAVARAQADFAARQVTLNTDGSRRVPLGSLAAPVGDPSLNLAGTLSYASGSNSLSGALSAGDMSGPSTATFYGPAAAELGGSYAVQNGGASRQMIGSYVLRKQ